MLLVRHGESEWNAVRRWQGQADPPLTERGERQAQTAATVISRRRLGPFDAVVTSTLRRAARTGDLIAGALDDLAVHRHDGLIERHAGPWQGLTRVEIEAQWPGFLRAGRRPDGYEHDESIVFRSVSALHSLLAEFAGSTLLVVSHGGVINALERHHGEDWVRLDNLEGRWFDVGPSGVEPIGERVHLADPSGESLGEAYA